MPKTLRPTRGVASSPAHLPLPASSNLSSKTATHPPTEKTVNPAGHCPPRRPPPPSPQPRSLTPSDPLLVSTSEVAPTVTVHTHSHTVTHTRACARVHTHAHRCTPIPWARIGATAALESRKTTPCGPRSFNHVGGKNLVTQRSLLPTSCRRRWVLGCRRMCHPIPGRRRSWMLSQ